MLNSLKELFQSRVLTKNEGDISAQSKSLEYAAAILMFEISRADSSIDAEERDVIDLALSSQFNLSQEEAIEIRTLAEKEVDHVISLHDFTRLLNESLSQEEKIRIIDLLWRVAFADAVLDKYEEYFIRKIADLLYISHKDYIQAKHRAAES